MSTQKEIYFACSIRGGRDDAELYAELVEYINTKAIVLTEIFADGTLTAQGSPGKTADIWKKDITWVKQADAIIAEVSNPSLGVGYEIAKAEEWGKPVLALFKKDDTRKLSAMIDGSPNTTVVQYLNLDEAQQVIDDFISQL